jgi:hypothetical protein
MILDFTRLPGYASASVQTWRAETNKRRYIIVKGQGGGYTAKVGTLKSGDQEDVFRDAPTFQAAVRACQSHSEGG